MLLRLALFCSPFAALPVLGARSGDDRMMATGSIDYEDAFGELGRVLTSSLETLTHEDQLKRGALVAILARVRSDGIDSVCSAMQHPVPAAPAASHSAVANLTAFGHGNTQITPKPTRKRKRKNPSEMPVFPVTSKSEHDPLVVANYLACAYVNIASPFGSTDDMNKILALASTNIRRLYDMPNPHSRRLVYCESSWKRLDSLLKNLANIFPASLHELSLPPHAPTENPAIAQKLARYVLWGIRRRTWKDMSAEREAELVIEAKALSPDTLARIRVALREFFARFGKHIQPDTMPTHELLYFLYFATHRSRVTLSGDPGYFPQRGLEIGGWMQDALSGACIYMLYARVIAFSHVSLHEVIDVSLKHFIGAADA